MESLMITGVAAYVDTRHTEFASPTQRYQNTEKNIITLQSQNIKNTIKKY